MREIKFRMWDKTDMKMKMNNFVIDSNGGVPAQSINEWGHRFVLMQYTGLKDKNDKEIYDCDIVATSYGNGEVVWVRDGWSLHLPEYLGDPGALYWWIAKGITVIGNKYETT